MKHNIRITIILLTLFVFSQIIGITIINNYIDIQKTKETGTTVWQDLPSIAGVKVERPQIEEKQSFWYIAGSILLGTILVLLIIHFGVLKLWKLWFFFAVAICLYIAYGAFTQPIIALILALASTYYKVIRPQVIIHNLTEIFVYGGLAALFVPIINMPTAIALLLFLSVYDAYAVWKSKHMIKMAKFQTQSKIFAGLFVPYKLGKPAKEKNHRMIKIRTAVLGGGDMGFPLVFTGVVLKTTGIIDAFTIIPFSTAALALLLWYGHKDKFYPAMPFITAGCLIGYVLTLLF